MVAVLLWHSCDCTACMICNVYVYNNCSIQSFELLRCVNALIAHLSLLQLLPRQCWTAAWIYAR